MLGARTALLTDLYELTMAAAYDACGLGGRVSFELFVRNLPPHRRFLVACGLEQALQYLETLRFAPADIEFLRSLELLPDPFLSSLANLRFTGDVEAIPEGRIVFPREPLLTISAPLVEAQLVETFLLNCVSFQTMIASKAARLAIACGERSFVDFSARRDHGADAAVLAARASFVGGAAGTATVAAGAEFGVPLSGTMAHSFLMAMDDEEAAFEQFARLFPGQAVLLVDTWDTLEGTRRAARVARRLAAEGIAVAGIRLDSGDAAVLSRQVRAILDAAGCAELRIVLSGDLDEHRVAALLADGAPVDAFGVGTQLGTSGDAPSLGSVYKLVQGVHGATMKRSTGKETLPGRKQVYRRGAGGQLGGDVIGLAGEDLGGEPLLVEVMRGGSRVAPPEPLVASQARCRQELARLPPALRRLDHAGEEDTVAGYPVALSPTLAALVARLAAEAR